MQLQQTAVPCEPVWCVKGQEMSKPYCDYYIMLPVLKLHDARSKTNRKESGSEKTD